MAKLVCPECEATLNPAKPPTPGKRVRCPRCDAVFTVPFEEEEDEPEERVRKEPAQKAAAGAKKKPPEKPKAAPPAAKPSGMDDDEEGGGVYGFLPSELQEEDEDKKPKINYAPDLSVKDPRGPAMKKLAVPSNWLIIEGAKLFFGGLLVFAIGIWPFVFGKYIVTPKEAIKEFKRREAEKKAPKKEQREGVPQEKEEEYIDDINEEEFRKQYPKAAQQLWERYFRRLVAMARRPVA